MNVIVQSGTKVIQGSQHLVRHLGALLFNGTVHQLQSGDWWVFRTSLYLFHVHKVKPSKDFLNREDFYKILMEIIQITQISLILLNKSAIYVSD